MTYMRSKILPPYVMLDKNLSKDTLNIKVRYLNEQAYAMSVYITLYQKRLKEASNKNKLLVTQFFKQATIDHKAFKNTDKGLPFGLLQHPGCSYSFLPRLRLGFNLGIYPQHRLVKALQIQIFLSYNRSSKRPTVQTSSLAVDLLRERFSFKNT